MAFRREGYQHRAQRLSSINPYHSRPPPSHSLSHGGAAGGPPGRYNRSEPDGPINEFGVYCGNLAWDVTSDMLKEHLSQLGTVVSCEVFLNYDGRSKGSALAKYESKESAARAIAELNDTDFKGRLLQVRPDREKPKREDDKPPVSMPLAERQIPPGVDSRRVYVGNLGWNVAWQDLKDHMRQAGEVVRAEIMQGPGGRSKGCGIVEFSNADEARAAISNLHDTELQGRLILVRQDKDDQRYPPQPPPHVLGSMPNHYQGGMMPMQAPIGPYSHTHNPMNMGSLGPPGYVMTDRYQQSYSQPPPPASHHGHSLHNLTTHSHHPSAPPPSSSSSSSAMSMPMWGHGHAHAQQQSLYSTPSGVPIPQLLSPRLYIGNLVYEVTWQELKDHMRQAGEVVRVDLKMSPDGVRNKGCGLVEFRDIQSAQRALAILSDSLLRGRPVFLREDREDRRMMTSVNMMDRRV